MVEMALSIVDNFDFQDVVVSLEVPRFSSGLAILTNEVRRASVRQHLISSAANTFSEAAAHSAWGHGSITNAQGKVGLRCVPFLICCQRRRAITSKHTM